MGFWSRLHEENIVPFLPDNEQQIFRSYNPTDFYPLEVEDTEEYRHTLEVIRDNLRSWMAQDQAFTASTAQPLTYSLSYSLKEIDLKFLPYPAYLARFKECLMDTEINNSGSRLMDVINRIYLMIPPRHMAVLQGRFIYGMIYGMAAEVNGRPLPSKEDWIDLLDQYPWVPFLAFIQDIYETDEVLAQVLKRIGFHGDNSTPVRLARRGNVPEEAPSIPTDHQLA